MARFHSTQDGIRPFTAEEEAEADALQAAYADHVWSQVRRHRDSLLAECDWVTLRAYSQGTSVPIEWAQYMQALRDITKSPDPFAITWPTKPSS